ncbi:MAG: PEP-CTERM sorting domain-containing protein [Planctomycetota bacterium]
MKKIFLTLALLVTGFSANQATAAITAFSDDFQSTGATFDGWVAFSDNGGFPGGYFIDTPSSTNPQIFQLANDGAGEQYLNFFANYDNAPVHNRLDPAQTPVSPNNREAISFFVDQEFTAADTVSGDTWTFDFDYAINPASPPSGGTEVGAFIRVFDPSFNLLDEVTFDTSGATAAFAAAPTLSVTLDPLWLEGRVQFGFNNLVGFFEGSGMFYDNVAIANASAVPEPGSLAILAFGSIAAAVRRRKR